MTLKRGSAPKAVRRRSSSAASLHKQVALLTRERDEALSRQTATADILRVISQSPTDLRPVFDSIVFTAVRLLCCDLVFMLLCDGATFSPAAVAAPEGPLADVGPTNLPIDSSANFPSRAILGKKMLHPHQRIGLDEPNVVQALAQGEPVQVADLREGAPSAASEVIQRAGFRALLVAPLLRGEEIVGMLVVRRRTPGAFPQNTVALIKTFAAQSGLAIRMRAYSRTWKPVPTNWGNHWRICEPHRIAWSRLRSSPRSVS